MAKPKKELPQENTTSIQSKLSTTALKNLLISTRNVRTLQLVNTDADNQLKASILAVGLIHNLAVTKEQVNGTDTGRYAVEAGGRRLRALQSLLADGAITEDYLVDINIFEDNQALDISLMENIHKHDMHPYDEFMAYKSMIETGSTIESIADKNGVTVTHVKRRLRLANVSPKVLEEYKNGSLNIEQLMTLCLTKDHNTQESVWFNAQSWNKTPRDLRKAITQDEVAMNDKRVNFVGVESYVARGGKLRTDLFSDGTGDTLLDSALLDSLVQERLALEADAIEKEGWAWVEFDVEMDWDYIYKFGREHKETKADLSDAEIAKQTELDEKSEALDVQEEAHQIACSEGTYETEQLEEEVEEMLGLNREAYEQELEAFNKSIEEWPNGIGELGVILYLDHNGKLERRDGLVRGKAKSSDNQLNSNGETQEAEKRGYSKSLVDYLFAVRTEALQLEVTKHTNVALALLAHKLILQVMPHYTYGDKRLSSLTTVFEKPKTQLAINDYDDTEVAKLKNELFDKWLNVLPATSEELLTWLLEVELSVVLDILAFCAGLSVSAVYQSDDEGYQSIANLVNLNVADYWKPSPDNFYNRISKADMTDILDANNKKLDQDTDKLKKKEMAVLVHDAVFDNEWLPLQVKLLS